MKICLVRPPLQVPRYQLAIYELPPIGLAYLASVSREAGHEVSVIDALGEAPHHPLPGHLPHLVGRGLSFEEIFARVPPDTEVMGVSCMFSQDWPYLRGLINEFRIRFPEVIIVAGGEHVTALAELVVEESAVDFSVCGEGEETLLELLGALEAGRDPSDVAGLVFQRSGEIVRTPTRARIQAINGLMRPAWDLFPVENYLNDCNSFGVDRGRCMPILATRGCPYQCTFCSSPSMWTTRWLARDPAEVLAEIRWLIEDYGVENVDFYDLTFIIKRDWILEFCGLIKESGLRFTYQLPTGTRAEAIDEKVAEALYETGCRNITYAPESGSPSELRRIKKKITIPSMLASMKAGYQSGLLVKSNIVLGFPGETRREILQTMGFIARMALVGVRDVIIFLFSPYPGSELHRELVDAGRLPEPSDEYFEMLSSTVDLSRAHSFCDLSVRELTAWRIGGLLLFYAVSFGVRPWRLIQTAYHLIRGEKESVLEERLLGLMSEVGAANKEKLSGGQNPEPSLQRAMPDQNIRPASSYDSAPQDRPGSH
jgi:anaerobic magnesium-protoporphyrin IX monomethyl ester cyclase